MRASASAGRLALALAATLAVLACSSSEDGNPPAGSAGSGNSNAGASAGSSGAAVSAAGSAGSGGTAGGAAPTTGIDGTKRLDALSEAERKTVCDFLAAKYGGYDHSIQCTPAKSISSGYANQSECVADWPTRCAVTIATYEQCVDQINCTTFVLCPGLASCTK